MSETQPHASQIFPGSAYQLLGTNSSATANIYLTLLGTANEIIVTPSGASITLSTPQAIGTTSSPTFASLTLTSPLAVSNGGTGATTSTGTGSVVLSNSPSLTTPALGTPSSLVLTNATGLVLTTGVTGILPVANGGTGLASLTAHDVLVGNGTGNVTLISPSTAGFILTSNGVGADPTFQASTGGVTSITGTPNQVIASASTGAVTLSLPQSIATTSNVTFGAVTAADIHATEFHGTLETTSFGEILFDDHTVNFVAVAAPSTITASYNLFWPTSQAVGTEVLQNDGSGNLSWGPASVAVPQYVHYVVGTPSGTYTGSTTVYNLPFSYTQDGKSLQVYYDGQVLIPVDDYNETSPTSVTTTIPLVVGTKIAFRTTTGGSVSAPVSLFREDYVVGTALNNYTGSTTVFNLVNSYTVGSHVLIVTLDGDVQTVGATVDYLETNSTTVTFNNALVVGERVSFIWSQTTSSGSGTVNTGTPGQFSYFAAGGSTVSGQTSLTLSGSNISLNSNKIVNLANGTAATDAVTFGQIFTGFQPIVQTILNQTSFTTTSSTSFVPTSNAATITPTSSSHRIKIICSATFEADCVVNSETYLTLYRNNTTNLGNSSVGFYSIAVTPTPSTGAIRCPSTITFIDSPATTSATTYTAYVASPQGVAIAYGRGVQIMILEEIV